MANVGGGAIQTSDLIADDGGIQSIIRQLTDLRDVVDVLYAKIANGAKLTYGSLKDLAEKNDNYNIILQETLHAAQAMYKAQEALRLSMSDYASIIADLKVKASNNNKETKLQAQLSNAVAGSVNHLKFEVAELTRQWENAATAQERASLAGKIRSKTAEIKELKAQLSNVVSTGKQTLTLWDKLERATSRLFTYTSQFKRNEGLIKQNATLKESKRLMDSLVQVQVKLDAIQGKKRDEYIQLAEKKQEFSLTQQLIDLQAKLNALNSADGKQVIEKTAQLKHQTDIMQKQAELAFAKEKAKIDTFPDGTPMYSSETNATVKAKTEFDIEQTRAEAEARVRGTKEAIEATAKLQQEEEKTARKIKKLRLEAIIENEEYKDTYKALAANVEYLRLKMEELPVDSAEWKEARAQLAAYADKLNKASRDMNKNTTVINERKRAWNGLTNATNQIVRELPTVGMRLDTFFLAISNNIPIFIDEINIARQEYINAGKSIKEANRSVTKDVIKNLVSWQTAVIVLLTVLTQWSKIKGLFQDMFQVTSEGAWKTSVAYDKLSKATAENTKKYGEQIAQIAMLKRKWDKASPEERNTFVIKYREELNKTGYAIIETVDAERLFDNYTGRMIQALAARAKATAALTLAQEQYSNAISGMIKVEKEIKGLFGDDTTLQDILEAFTKYYNVSDTSKNGKFTYTVSRAQLRQMAYDYVKTYEGEAYTDSLFEAIDSIIASGNTDALKNVVEDAATRSIKGEGTRRIFRKLLTDLQYEQADVSAAVMLQLGVAAKKGTVGQNVSFMGYGSQRQLRVAAQELDDGIARGEQAIDLMGRFLEEGKDIEEAFDLATTAVLKLAEKIQDLDIKAFKTYYNAQLDAIGVPAYERGGGVISMYGEDLSVTNSFQKERIRLKINADKAVKQLDKDIEDAENLKLQEGITEKDIARIDANIEIFQKARDKIRDAVFDDMDIVTRDETIATLQAAKGTIDARLNAIREGNVEEIELRRKSIKKAMQIELAENAKLEPLQRRSAAAIREKYNRELEMAERDYAIKRNNWRKQQLETEQAANVPNTFTSTRRQMEILRIEMQNELLENVELIKEGLISDFDITKKYIRQITKAWSDYAVSVNNAYKTFWDYASELANDDTWEQEQAELVSLELQKQIELENNRELIEQYDFLADTIEQVYEKRKKLLSIQKQMARFDKVQQTALINFGIQRQGEQATERFGLQQELDRLVYERNLKVEAGVLSQADLDLYEAQIASLRKQLRELTPVARVAQHGLIGLLDLTTEEYSAVDTWASQMSESINSVVNSYISLAQAAVDASKAQVDAAQRALDAELEARANGYANNVQGAKAELALERSKARQKEAVLRQAQKTQLAIDTVTQVSNLITASAEILKTFAAFPGIAYAMIAAMFGTFAIAKVQAYKLANQTTYGAGGYEIAQGGSHASGHDIKTGIATTSGRQMVIEGGEGVGVFSKKAVTKYGDIIPNIVHDINAGTLKQMDYTQGILSATPVLPIYHGTDVSLIEQKLDELIAISNNDQFVLPDGSVVERKGNVTRKIRK